LSNSASEIFRLTAHARARFPFLPLPQASKKSYEKW